MQTDTSIETSFWSAPPAALWGGSGFVPASLVGGLAAGSLTPPGEATVPASLLPATRPLAVWVIVAFIVGRFARSWKIANAAGFVSPAGEIAGYCVSSWCAVAGEPDWRPYSLVILMGVGAAVAAGPLFGWAGFFSHYGLGRLRKIAAAASGAVFIGEGVYPIGILGYWQGTYSGHFRARVSRTWFSILTHEILQYPVRRTTV